MEILRTAEVKAPATSANLGSGFDCVGIALDLWNSVVVKPSEKFQLVINGEGETAFSRDGTNLLVHAFKVGLSYVKTGHMPVKALVDASVPQVRIECENNIPMGRGLGSSSAAIVCGLTAALLSAGPTSENAAEGRRDDVYQMACVLEGHPDNVAPALFGGVQVGYFDENEEKWKRYKVPIPNEMKCVAWIPDWSLNTSDARMQLPSEVPRADAVFNLARTGLLVAAFCTGDLSLLNEATKDKLHQPYRRPLMPHMESMISAALEAGAAGACVSGAGPTIIAFTDNNDEVSVAVDRAFKRIATLRQFQGRSQIFAFAR